MPFARGCIKSLSPLTVYVVTVILSSFKGRLTCGSWLCVAVVSEETEELSELEACISIAS